MNDLNHAAELLERLLPATTPGPWADTSVNGNRYGALIAVECHRGCTAPTTGPDWTRRHPHEGYGGCLVGESIYPEDRRLLAVLRNVADDLPRLLRAVRAEDPIVVGEVARAMAAAVVSTHRPEQAAVVLGVSR
jgi:hypothetical protein